MNFGVYEGLVTVLQGFQCVSIRVPARGFRA